MDYEFSYRLENTPEATTDGSGQVRHPVAMVYRVVDSGDNWKTAQKVPGHTATVLIPASEIATVMNMPHSNAGERQVKNAAYKVLLQSYRSARSLALGTGWDESAAQAFLSNNDDSATEATNADFYITDTLGQEYPLPFG
jgi:hypothetical protein